jgi:hypothetical protein
LRNPKESPEFSTIVRRFPWVVTGAFEYEHPVEVIKSINDHIFKPVEAKLKELSM